MKLRAACMLLLLAACAGEPGADQPLWGDQVAEPLDLRGELASNEVALLAETTLRLDLYVGEGLEIDFAPDVPPKFAGSVETLPAVPWGNGEWRRFALTLRPLEVGDLTIPSFKVEAGEDGPVATSPTWNVTVTSVLADAGSDVEAPAPLFDPALVWWPWAAGAGGLLALLALLWWWRRRRGDAPQVTETPVPSHVKALRALSRLRQAPRATPSEVEAFYVEVSHILRVYLEERFGLHAPERTTEEFLVEMERDARLTVEQRSVLGQFLAQCDMVKFARMQPTEQVHDATFESAEGFVEATREDRIREGAA